MPIDETLKIQMETSNHNINEESAGHITKEIAIGFTHCKLVEATLYELQCQSQQIKKFSLFGSRRSLNSTGSSAATSGRMTLEPLRPKRIH